MPREASICGSCMPLYYWAGDSQPGDVNGYGVKGVWFVVHPDTASMAVANPVIRMFEHPTLGNILHNQGMTLYWFAKDEANVSNCYGDCAVNWPPLLVAGGAPVAGEGVTGELGVIERTDGTRQVTYNGLPLYFFAKDKVPGDVNGQGVKDVWFVVSPESAAGMPPILPVTGGQSVPWAGILLTIGGLALLGGLILIGTRRAG